MPSRRSSERTSRRGPDPTNIVVRALLVRSGNECAFPGCTHPVVNAKNQFVAEVCHIRGAAPGGERYDPTMSADERRGYDNLLILCHAHHVETDDVIEFTVARLLQMKADHDGRSRHADYAPPESVVAEIADGMARYWAAVEAAAAAHVLPDRAIQIDPSHGADDLLVELRRCHDRVAELFNRPLKNPSSVGQGSGSV